MKPREQLIDMLELPTVLKKEVDETEKKNEISFKTEDEFKDALESQDTSTSTPIKSLKRELSSIVDDKGQILDDTKQPIPASNIADLEKYFSNRDAKKKRKPLGYKETIEKLVNKKSKIDIKNKEVRKDFEKQMQKGSGTVLWSSLKKF